MSPILGEIRMYVGPASPEGWTLCDGSLLTISEHPDLYSLIGTTYGGDGRITFASPDLRNRSPLHRTDAHPVGELGYIYHTYDDKQFVASDVFAKKRRLEKDRIGKKSEIASTCGINFILCVSGHSPHREEATADPHDHYCSEVCLFSFNFTPAGFLPCEGQILTEAALKDDRLVNLFILTGGGHIPDLRERIPKQGPPGDESKGDRDLVPVPGESSEYPNYCALNYCIARSGPVPMLAENSSPSERAHKIDAFPGEIRIFPSCVPERWRYCKADCLVIDANVSPLYELIGTTYGTIAPGRCFNLPDLDGRLLVQATGEQDQSDLGAIRKYESKTSLQLERAKGPFIQLYHVIFIGQGNS